MKELFAGFAADIFRPIVTLLIPGFWALTPWVAAMLLHFPITWQFANVHRNDSGLALVVVATALGMIFENLGGRVENRFFHSYTKGDKASWYAYLALAPEREPIGFRYIRTIVLRMKFELGMAVAGLIVMAGTICIPVSLSHKVETVCFTVALTLYLLYEGKSSVKELENTRRSLLNMAPIPDECAPAKEGLCHRLWMRFGGRLLS